MVDIEHATPFVGEKYLRFDTPRTKWLIRGVLERDNCLGIICWSHACKRAFLMKCPSKAIAEKVYVAHPSLDLERQAVRSFPRTALRRLLFVFNNPDHNFFIKSGLEVVCAFKMARAEEPGLELHIVGPVPTSAAQGLADAPGITLYGKLPRAKLDEVYVHCDLLILPTVTDTFGMAFLEAFARGMPALAIRWFAVPEIVQHGYNGLLVDKPSGLPQLDERRGHPSHQSERLRPPPRGQHRRRSHCHRPREGDPQALERSLPAGSPKRWGPPERHGREVLTERSVRRGRTGGGSDRRSPRSASFD